MDSRNVISKESTCYSHGLSNTILKLDSARSIVYSEEHVYRLFILFISIFIFQTDNAIFIRPVDVVVGLAYPVAILFAFDFLLVLFVYVLFACLFVRFVFPLFALCWFACLFGVTVGLGFTRLFVCLFLFCLLACLFVRSFFFCLFVCFGHVLGFVVCLGLFWVGLGWAGVGRVGLGWVGFFSFLIVAVVLQNNKFVLLPVN